ncbi:MAG: O-antigen ligase family protein, partial [Desulfobacteraceae bacterium]|nr:O-antigen ligase family protein [Desulfobacteraceae bacterium]
FFPVQIPFLGRDALTSGTICIFLFFLKYLLDSFFQRNFIKERYDYLVYTLILFGALSIIYPLVSGDLHGGQTGHALRQYVSFFSAILFFIMLKSIRPGRQEAVSEQVEKLIGFFILLVALHVLISFLVKMVPSLGFLFNIFLPRDVESFDSVQREGMQRIGSFVFSPEKYGEILAALSPVVMYKIYKFRNPVWICCLFLFALGLIVSVTRSGILLFLAGISLSMLYHFKKKIGKTLLLANLGLAMFFLVAFFKGDLLDDVFTRFAVAANTYSSTGNIVETMNRGGVFYDAWDLVVSNVTLFGNGITEFNFHNLFLTTIYQKGVLGMALFFIVLLIPVISLAGAMKSPDHGNKELVFACLLSLFLFLVNETKFEFTRDSSYQQIWWGIIALYYLVSRKQEVVFPQSSHAGNRAGRHSFTGLEKTCLGER